MTRTPLLAARRAAAQDASYRAMGDQYCSLSPFSRECPSFARGGGWGAFVLAGVCSGERF
jgi:hypothetical protein